MTRKQLLIAIGVVGVVGILLVPWTPPGPRGFATPADCVENYAEACKTGDVPRYLACLAEPLRVAERSKNPREFAESLRQRMSETKSWVQQPAQEMEGSKATVDVDEIRSFGSRRLRFHLEKTSAGWLITAIDSRDLPTKVRYGTHVSEPVDGNPPKTEP
jgi:hypothetical protein